MASTSRDADIESSMEWQDIEDEDDFLTAIKNKNIFDVYETIKSDEKRQIINNQNSSGEHGIDIAWEKEYYDIVLLLLLADYSFPVKFEYKEHTSHPLLKTLIMHVAKWKSGLHQKIIGGNLEDVEIFIKGWDVMKENYLSQLKCTIDERTGNSKACEFELKYFKPKHYFNYSKSATATALENKKYEIFAYLKSINIKLTDIEDKNIYQPLDDKILEKITESINKFSSPIDDAHIFYLVSITESFPSNESVTEEWEFKNKVDSLFKKLDKINQISIIMKYLHRCDNFKIIVDLHNDLTCELDPTNKHNFGITYYLKRRIYVGLGSASSLGTLAHELTHLAMYEMFKNFGKPYEEENNSRKDIFKQLILEAKQKLDDLNNKNSLNNIEIRNIIQTGFSNFYNPCHFEAETIARISEVLAVYKDNGKSVMRSYFAKLFSFFNTIIKEIKNATKKRNLKRFSKDLKLLNRAAAFSRIFHKFQLKEELDSSDKDYENKLSELINSNDPCEIFVEFDRNKLFSLYSSLKKIKKELSADEYYIFPLEFCYYNLQDITDAFFASDADWIFILIAPNEKSENQQEKVIGHFLGFLLNCSKKVIFLLCGSVTEMTRKVFADAHLFLQGARKETIESLCEKNNKDFEKTWEKEITVLKNFQRKLDDKFILNSLQFSNKKQLSFLNFCVESQNQLLQKNNIILQGNPTSLGKLLRVADAEKLTNNDLEFVRHLESGVIEKIIYDEDVIVGRNLPPFDFESYETRNFNKVLIKRNIKTKKSFCDILCYSQENFETLCCEYPDKNVHWLKEESKRFIWQKTSGSVENLREFRKSEKKLFYSEAELVTLQSNLKVILISNVAGMGKTTVLSHLCQILKNSSDNCVWIFKLDLKFYNETLYTNQMNTEDLIYFILNLHDKPLDKALFNTGKIKTIILFDGFDEMNILSRKLLKNIIQYLTKKVTNIWLTTRDDLRSDLENELGVFSISLQPISENEAQAKFLNKMWRSKLIKEGFNFEENELAENKIKLFSKELVKIFCKNTAIISNDKFLSLPLHLKMVGEIFYEKNNKSPEDLEYVKDFIKSKNKKPNLRKTLEVLDLYQKFLDNTIRVYYLKNKLNIDESQNSNAFRYYYKHLISMCQMLALKIIIANPNKLTLFPVNYDGLKEFEQEIMRSTENLGLVYRHSVDEIDEGVPSFLHLTYAEYLSSELIAEHLMMELSLKNSTKIQSIFECLDEIVPKTTLLFIKNIWRILKKKDFFTKVKSGNFLNLAAQNGFFNIFKSIHELKFENLDEKNETGKTAVILAAEYGKPKILEYVFETFEKNQIEALKVFVNEKDETGRTALSYAIIEKHFEIGYNLLMCGADSNKLNYCENTHSFVQFVCEKSVKEYKMHKNDHCYLCKLANIVEKLLLRFPNTFENSIDINDSCLHKLLIYFLWEGLKLVFECVLKCIPSTVKQKVLTCDNQCIVTVICESFYLSEDEKIDILKNISEYVPFQILAVKAVELGLFKVFLHFNKHRETLPQKVLKTTFKNSRFVFAYYLLNKSQISFKDENPLHLAIESSACLKLLKCVFNWETDHSLKNKQLLSRLSNKNDCHALKYMINQRVFDNLAPDSITLHSSKDSDFIRILFECGAKIYGDEIIISEDNSLRIRFDSENPMDLIYAIKNKKFAWSKFIIRHGGDVNRTDQEGKTALHWACRMKSIEIIQLLLQYGAIFDMKDKNDSTPIDEWKDHSFSSLNDQEKNDLLQLVAYLELLGRLFCSKETFNVAECENSSWCILNARNAKKSTILHIAVENNNLMAVNKILDLNKNCLKNNLKWQFLKDKSCELYKNYQPLSVDAEDINGNSPLHIACRKDEKSIIWRLLEEGATFNAKNEYEETPENLAKNAKYLLTCIKNCFDDIKSGTMLNLNEIHLLCFCVKNNDGETLLHCTVRNKLQGLFEILLGKNIDLNCQNLLGCTPLHLAAKDNNIDMVKKLLQRGAFFNIVNKECLAPLELAKNLPDSDTFKFLNQINEMFQIVLSENPERIVTYIKSVRLCYLSQQSVPLSIIVNAFDRTNNCALHYAVKYSYISVVKLLLENGAIYNCKNQFDKSPQSIASCQKIQQLLQLVDDLFLLDVESFDKIKKKVGFKILNNVRNDMGLTLLHNAVNEDKKIMFIKLMKSGANIKAQDSYGKNIEYYAKKDIKKIVKQYLQMQEHIQENRIDKAEKLWKIIHKFYQSDSTGSQKNSSNQIRFSPPRSNKPQIADLQDQSDSTGSQKNSSNQIRFSPPRSKKPRITNLQDQSDSTGNQKNSSNQIRFSPPRSKKPRITNLQDFQFDEILLFQLTDMGLSMNESKRALQATQNYGIDEALDWFFEHIDDEDLDEPLCLPESLTIDLEAQEAIIMMGFNSDTASLALKSRGNNFEEAVNWIFRTSYKKPMRSRRGKKSGSTSSAR